MKKVLVALGLILVVGLVVFNLASRPVNSKDPVELAFEIPEESSVKDIVKILDDQGLIKNSLVFKYKLRASGSAGSLKAGKYKMSTSMDMDQIIGKLVEGPDKNTLKFTIPEGYEIRQIADRLSDLGLVDRQEFIDLASDRSLFEDRFEFLKELEPNQGLEGFLYPATYEVYVDEKAQSIIERMLAAFDNIYKKEIKSYLDQGDLNLNQLVTLASIIEREGKIDRERPIMAGVFYNRLEQNMRLQSCATVQYILGERKAVLSNKDTRTPSLYNTYLHYGLPPAPIASPGEASILAAIYPEDSDYLYFVLTGEDGSHSFSKTYQEHLDAQKN